MDKTVLTDLPDLEGVSFQSLEGAFGGKLRPYEETLLNQVEKPRYNLGSGPPGRAD